MKENRIDKYWSKFFGVDSDVLNTQGISVVPHQYLEGYQGAWIFKRKGRVIISVPPEILDEVIVKMKSNLLIDADYFSKDFIEYIFQDKIDKIIGPVWQGYLNNSVSNIQISEKIRRINFVTDKKMILQLSDTGDDEGWEDGGINENSECIYGYFSQKELIAVASYKMVKGDAGFIGVYTRPESRGKGFSSVVTKAIVRELTIKGKLMIYQTLVSNGSSIRVAERTGFNEYGKNVAIRLK